MTEPDQQNEAQQEGVEASSPAAGRAKTVLNGVIVVLLLTVGYLSYSYISRGANSPPLPAEQPKPQKIIQLDVLNGSGGRGVAAKFMNYLRGHGFDVVEMKNYKLSNIPRTLVVDRVGNRAAAQRVASALGVSERNVIQQINPDYFVDVSVIIGGDYSSLQPLH
ncbi:MAG TPA: LytR C-terminal domain-containing protein [Bacteroidota bacterium]|nr:LytR C-terminal domain-containing protein [Bacteroidota bacterium]